MTESIVISNCTQSDDAHAGMLDVEDFGVHELTAALRASARGVCRLEAAGDLLITYRTERRRRDLRSLALRLTNVRELVWRKRQAVARVAGGSPASASDNATLRIAPTRVERDTRDSLGAFVSALERPDGTTKALNAIAHPVTEHQRGPAVVNDHVDSARTRGLPNG